MDQKSAKLEKKVYNCLKISAMINERTISKEINELLGIALGVQTNENMLLGVKIMFNTFLAQKSSTISLNKTCNYENIIELSSQKVMCSKIQVNKEGFFRVMVTDNILVAYFRWESIDSTLRQRVVKILTKNNTNINIYKGAKHTAIGLVTREENIIANIDVQKIYDILVDIYGMLF